MNLEENVRTAVRDLADEAPAPHDLAAIARTRGRRIRRRRRAGFGALAVALVAITVAPYALLRREAPAPPVNPAPVIPAPVTPAPAKSPAGDWWRTPYRLPGGAIVTALSHRDVGLVDAPLDKTVHDGNALLNRKTGEYTVLPGTYYTVWGAPVGGLAAASNGVGGTGIVDAFDGRGIWRDISIDPVWSADGTRILYSTDEGFAIVEAATWDIRYRTTPMDLCPDVCTFSWLPGEQEVAVARRDPAVAQSEDKSDTVKDVAIYSAADARLLRVVPVAGIPVRQGAWSPDRRLVLVRDQKLGRPNHIVEVETGRTVGSVAGENVQFLPSGQVLSLTDGKAALFDAHGRLLTTQMLPADFRGRELSVGRL